MQARLYTDGGSRGNPGPAAYGFVIEQDGVEIFRQSATLGHVTNSVAEYSGLIAGLEAAHKLGVTDIEVYSDSEFMVKQMLGEYKVRSADMVSLHQTAQQLAARFNSLQIGHIFREQNRVADGLVNDALDRG